MFDYQKNIWGKKTAGLEWTDPSNTRLRRALRVLKKLPAGARVLEIGCGAGSFIRAIKEARPDFLCYGLDLSKEAITIAKSSADKVIYYLGDGRSLSFDNNFFDAVLFFDVLEHVESPVGFLQEAHRVLKSRGLIHAFVPCEGDSFSLWYWLDKIRLKKNLTEKFAGHIQYFSRKELSGLFKNVGFVNLKKNYSEHFLGQVLGLAIFFVMNKKAKKNEEMNNELFFNQNPGNFFCVKKIVNFLISLESRLFFFLPSPNVHLTGRKK